MNITITLDDASYRALETVASEKCQSIEEATQSVFRLGLVHTLKNMLEDLDE